MALTRKQRKIIEQLGWNISIEAYANGKMYYLSQYSPLGEDFGFSIDYDNPIKQIHRYYCNFDAEEHVEGWLEYRGTRGVPNSIKALVEDAEAIEQMLYELVKAL